MLMLSLKNFFLFPSSHCRDVIKMCSGGDGEVLVGYPVCGLIHTYIVEKKKI